MWMVFQATEGLMKFIQSFGTEAEADTLVKVLSPSRPPNTIYIVIQGTVS